MKTLCGIAVVGLVLLVTVAPCAGADGNALLRDCRIVVRWEDGGMRDNLTSSEWGHYMHCKGFVRGLYELNLLYSIRQSSESIQESKEATDQAIKGLPQKPQTKRYCSGAFFCLTEEGIDQMERVIVRYLETHPERLRLRGSLLAIEALRDAFPCSAPALALRSLPAEGNGL